MKRLLALALALGMMLTVMSVGVFAAEPTTQEGPFTVPAETKSYDNVTFTGTVSVAATDNTAARQVTFTNCTFQSSTFGFASQNENGTKIPELTVRFENCRFKNNASKGIYITNAKQMDVINCTFENVAQGTDTGHSGDYGIDANLCGVTDATINVIGCTFDNVGHKSAVKVTARGGVTDTNSGITAKPAATIASVTVSNNTFKNIDGVELALGTSQKKADSDVVNTTTGDFPTSISGNLTDMRVEMRTASLAGETITVLSGASAYILSGKVIYNGTASSEPTEAEKAQQAAVSETTTAVSEAVSVLSAAATGDAEAVKELAKTAETVTTAAGETLTAPVISIDSTVMPTIPWNLGDAMSGQSLLLKVKTADGYVYINTALIPKCGANRIFWPMSYLIQMFGITK